MKGTTNAEKGGQGVSIEKIDINGISAKYYRYFYQSGSYYARLGEIDDAFIPALERLYELASNNRVLRCNNGYIIPDYTYFGSSYGGVDAVCSYRMIIPSYSGVTTSSGSTSTFIFRKDGTGNSYDNIPVGKWYVANYKDKGTVPTTTETMNLSLTLYIVAGGGGELTESLISCAHEGVCA